MASFRGRSALPQVWGRADLPQVWAEDRPQ